MNKKQKLFHSDFHDDLRESVSCDMEVDEVFTGSLDMCLVRELDILLLELDRELLIDSCSDRMFIESTEYLSILPLQCEGNTLSVEVLLDLEGLSESDTSLIACSSIFFMRSAVISFAIPCGISELRA